MRVQTTEKIVNTKVQIVQDAGKELGANTILHRVVAHPCLLEDVCNIIDKDVDIISNQIITADLTEPQAKELSERITVLVDTANTDVATLKVGLIQAKGTLRATASAPLSPTSDGSTDGSGIFSFGSEIAKHLATLTAAAEKDKSSPPKNANNFGYNKIQVPEFSGNV